MKIKKVVALVLATTLVFGSAVTVFASNPTSGSDEAEGTGVSNGHVDQKVVSVSLPTDVGTTFDYVADPEDLVGQTKDSTSNKGKTKTGTEVAPNDDLIYFHNAAVTADADKDIAAVTEGYSSTSNTVRVTNKSSHAISLTVSAAVEANDNNMAIADDASDIATATTTPTVHFDLLTKAKGAANEDETAVITTNGVAKAEKKDISIDGVSDNFELTQSGTGADGAYKYDVKSDVKDKDWNYVDISLKGACSKATTTDDLVAPKFILTWSWVDPGAGPQISVNASSGLITITGLTADQNITALKLSNGTDTVDAGTSNRNVTWDTSNWSTTDGGSCTIQLSGAWADSWAGDSVTATMTLSDASTKSATFTMPESFE